MQETMRLEKYFPASEVTVLAVCFVMVILLVVSFKVRMKSFRMFAAMLWMLIVATCSDLMLHFTACAVSIMCFFSACCITMRYTPARPRR